VVPLVADTVPLPGAVSSGEHAFAVQLRGDPVQLPVDWHVVNAMPTSVKPWLQEYVCVEPNSPFTPVTLPLAGATNGGAQSAGSQYGLALVQVPLG